MSKQKFGLNWEHHYRTGVSERRYFEEGGANRETASPPSPEEIGDLVRQIDDLQVEYDRTMNPVYVWEAIMLLGILSKREGQPMTLPSWVAAYLVEAAGYIQGVAVQWEPPKVAEKRAKAVANGHSTKAQSFKGLNPDERVRVANEALGFKQGRRGTGPFIDGYRDELRRKTLREAEKLKAAGKPQALALRAEYADPKREIARMKAKSRKQRSASS